MEAAPAEAAPTLRRPRPGALYPWLVRFAWVETLVFAALLATWLGPGMDGAKTVFGWSHGIGYLALVGLLFGGVVRHEVPYWLLLITFNPLGPVGTVIGFELLERRRRAGRG